MSLEFLAERAQVVRTRIIAMGASHTGTHVGGSLSAADLLTVLYHRVLRVRPDEPDWPGRDRFVLSKGHASAALYAVLADRGFFDPTECDTYGQYGSRLAGHPLRRLPGVEFPTGSLGHGLSLGVGLALALRLAAPAEVEPGDRPARVFVLLGDGELQEGSVWEAVMAGAHLRLDTLTAVVDRNGWQISGTTEECMALEPLAERWAAFGWAPREVDGHDLAAVCTAFDELPYQPGRPSVVIARTTKGRGVSMFENRKKSHYVTLTPALYQRAMAGLRARSRP
jgi:transketolase